LIFCLVYCLASSFKVLQTAMLYCRLNHLKDQFYTPGGNYGWDCQLTANGSTVNAIAWPLAGLHGSKLSEPQPTYNIILQSLPSGKPTNTSAAAYCANSATHPHVLVAAMVFDKFETGPVHYGIGRHGSQAINVTVPLKEDLIFGDLLQPKCHATVSESMLRQHREYVAQRKRCEYCNCPVL
jgi:hypothetical protein